MTNLEKYKNVFCENFEITEDKVEGLTYHEAPFWDSIGHMGLITLLEDTFNITLENDDIIDLSSYEKGIEILKKYGISF